MASVRIDFCKTITHLHGNHEKFTSNTIWSDYHSQEKYSWIGEQNGFHVVPDDWYGVTWEHISPYNGGKLVNLLYSGSIAEALTTIYPDVEWHPWRFTHCHPDWWNTLENHVLYFMWLSQQLGVEKLDDWYQVSSHHVVDHDGWQIMKDCHGTLSKGLSKVFPDVHWQLWRFDNVPSGFWENPANCREYFDWLGSQLKISDTESWYNVKLEDVLQHDGSGLVNNYYEGSLCHALMTVYSEVHWQPWRFQTVPNSYWNEPHHQRQFLDWVGEQLQLHLPGDWYNTELVDIVKYGGGYLVTKFDGSASKTIMNVYADTAWQPWRFAAAPGGFWEHLENQREYFDWLGEHIGVEQWEDWYDLTLSRVIQNYGGGLLAMHYDNSPSRALMSVYWEYEWHPWQFAWAPSGFWSEVANRRIYLEWLAEQLSIAQVEDWYKVHQADVYRHCGKTLLKYTSSLSPALVETFPDSSWQPWRFSRVMANYWREDNCGDYVDFLEQQLNVVAPDDWYGVSGKLVESKVGIHGNRMSLIDMLKRCYPEESWDIKQWILGHGGKVQQMLLSSLSSIYGASMEVVGEGRLSWAFPSKKSLGVELDVWIPAENVGIEYQGIQHYSETLFMNHQGGFVGQVQRDKEKEKLLQEMGIKMVQLPYWWNYDVQKLANQVDKDTTESWIAETLPLAVSWDSILFQAEFTESFR